MTKTLASGDTLTDGSGSPYITSSSTGLVSWGSIGGTISSQSDLWTQLTNRFTKSESISLLSNSNNWNTAYTWVSNNSNGVAYLFLRTNAWNQVILDLISETNRAIVAEGVITSNLSSLSNVVYNLPSNNWNIAYNWVSLNSNAVSYLFSRTNAWNQVILDLISETNRAIVAENVLTTNKVSRDGSTPATADWTMNGWRLKDLPSIPSADNDAASKFYVDNMIDGLSWKQSVKTITNNITSSLVGNRYLVATNATGNFAGKANNIAICTNSAPLFSFQIPTNGWAVFVEDTKYGYVYNSDSIMWVPFAGATTYIWNEGLAANGNIINVNYGTGLIITNKILTVDTGWFDGRYLSTGSPTDNWNTAYSWVNANSNNVTQSTNKVWDISGNTNNYQISYNWINSNSNSITSVFNTTDNWNTAYSWVNANSNTFNNLPTNNWNNAYSWVNANSNQFSINTLLLQNGTDNWNNAYSWVNNNSNNIVQSTNKVWDINNNTNNYQIAYSWVNNNSNNAAYTFSKTNVWDTAYDWVNSNSNSVSSVFSRTNSWNQVITDLSSYSNNLASTTYGSEGFHNIGALGGYNLKKFMEDIGIKGPSRDKPTFIYTLTNIPPPSFSSLNPRSMKSK